MLGKVYYIVVTIITEKHLLPSPYPAELLFEGELLKLELLSQKYEYLKVFYTYMKILLQTLVPSYTLTGRLPETIARALLKIMNNFNEF